MTTFFPTVTYRVASQELHTRQGHTVDVHYCQKVWVIFTFVVLFPMKHLWDVRSVQYK